MSTPNSGTAAYCSNQTFLVFFDGRNLADLISDADTPVAVGTLPTNATLTSILQAASGEVEMWCLKGNKYQPSDLAMLTGNMALKLAKIVANIAFGMMLERRPDKAYKMPESVLAARKELEQVSKGVEIFGLVEVQAAGNIGESDILEPDIEVLDLATFGAQRLFGVRQARRRPFTG
jgi:hypothetical protein